MALQETAAGSPTQGNRNLTSLPDPTALAERGQQAFAGWLRSSEVAMKGSFDLAAQIMSFGQARLEADLKVINKLMACRDLKDVAECQRLFAEKAAEQYLDQANKLTGKLTSFFTEATERNGSKPQA